MPENAGKTALPCLWGQGAGGWGVCRDIKNSPLPIRFAWRPVQLCYNDSTDQSVLD